MKLDHHLRPFRAALFLLLAYGSARAAPPPVDQLLDTYCFSCHGERTQKAEIRLDQLDELEPELRLEILNKVEAQIFFEQMPPKKRKRQPTKAERTTLLEWISDELEKHGASRLKETLKRPEYGNWVDHEKLFSGEYAHLPGYTRDRRWLVSEFIFDAKVNDLIDHPGVRSIDGMKRNVVGDNGVNLGTRFGGHSLRQSITNPFLLPTTIGVRYYDTTTLTGGHLLTMVSSAKKIASYMSSEKAMKTYYPAMHRILAMELSHRDTLRSREQFLTRHIARILRDFYGHENEALLPELIRMEVEEVPEYTDGKGNPRKRDNVGLLARYDPQDLDAIYLGVGLYKRDDVTFKQVIEKCERDWFTFGIHEKRIRTRIRIMKVLDKQWDMARVYEDIRKKNIRPAPYRPLADAEMKVIAASIRKHRQKGDRYRWIIKKCQADWEESFRQYRGAAGQASDEQIGDLVVELFSKIYEREPGEEEAREKVSLTKSYLKTLSTQEAIAKLIETLILSSELVYRSEFGQGPADEHGRRKMSPRDAGYALAYALTDSSPDAELVAAVKEGRLTTREDYRREVIRMLARRDQYYVIDESVQKAGFNASITNQPIRKLRFFREFFGYPMAMKVFKDDTRFGAGRHDGTVGRLIDEADMLVAHILEEDRDVFEQLLTTERFYVFHSGDNAVMQAASDRLRTIYDYFRKHDWKSFTQKQLYDHWPFIQKMKMRGTVFADFETNERRRSGWIRSFKRTMESLELRLGKGQGNANPYDELPMAYWHKGNATGRTGQVMRAHEVTTYFNIDYRDWDYPATQPAKIPHRKGILTHPAWLIAHSLNTETDPVRRGKWIREKLLAGTIPDVPITVDAVIPEDPHKTLRQRLKDRTGDAYCWNCHQRMDPLGVPFESYDDFGRHRTEEKLEYPENLITERKKAPLVNGIQVAVYKSLPVETGGVLDGTGDSTLDGKVRDTFELVERLGKSARARQSILRHAFRYFMGRNEMLSDSKTLIDAEKAYLDNDGSFDAVIVSLLTSDSFLFRKAPAQKP